ncbi:unnamed protein product [Caenorhabditis auriculariae]|uniref:Transient receptor ion channel domain-containing protein n=1 Tax=Caenorhabditis auriculariae TaxID=2777116 RepID=A0A8S1GZD3_9PELO|nr:unnamed protein product [Caenorhabditis auriculariae]
MNKFLEDVRRKDRTEVLNKLNTLANLAEDGRIKEICNYVLQNSSISLKEAQMHAIMTGNLGIVEHVTCLFIDYPFDERKGCTDSPTFEPHVTPLILACKNNDFPIVEFLLSRGHSIDIPHFRSCTCNLCSKMPAGIGINARRIDVLRAVTSEAYLWLATDDVFSACCSVVKDLQMMKSDGPLEFVETFQELEVNVQKFVAKLSEHFRMQEEFDVVMCSKRCCSLADSELVYPRIQLALDASMRQFISGAHVQSAIRSVWLRDWGNFGMEPLRDAYRIGRHVFLYPLLALLFTVSNGKIASSFNVPIARFVSHVAAYASFLFAVLFHRRVSSHTLGLFLECYFFLYILGLLFEKYLLFTRLGFNLYFSFWWRWFDFLLLAVFNISLFVRLETFLVGSPIKLLHLERTHWSAFEYDTYHEIFLTGGYIFAIWKVFYYCQLLKKLGISVLTAGKCVAKLYHFLTIMAIVIFSFAVGLNMMLYPYNQTNGLEKLTAFNTIPISLETLYWSFFGYLDPKSYRIQISEEKRIPIKNEMPATNVSVEMFVALFHIVIIIVLLNLITALLVKTAEEVQDNEELEYKYTRAAIYSEFFTWEHAVPPPFNLIHVPVAFFCRLAEQKNGDDDEDLVVFYQVLRKLYDRFRASKDYRSACNQNLLSEVQPNEGPSAPDLYLRKKTRTQSASSSR